VNSVLTIPSNKIALLKFNEKSFCDKLSGFTKTEFTVESYTSGKSVVTSGIDKSNLKCDSIEGSLMIGIRKSFLCSFPLDKAPGHKMIKLPRTELLKK